jgi:hypothetical protein
MHPHATHMAFQSCLKLLVGMAVTLGDYKLNKMGQSARPPKKRALVRKVPRRLKVSSRPGISQSSLETARHGLFRL